MLFDIINNFITFFLGYYIQSGAISFSLFTIPTKNTELIFITTHQDIFLNQILKKSSIVKIDNFLKITKKISKKKKQLINAFKFKANIDKSKPKRVIFIILDYFKEERLQILIPEAKVSTFAIKKINVTIINANCYCADGKLKRARIFLLCMRDLEYQVIEKARLETILKSVLSEEYHDF